VRPRTCAHTACDRGAYLMSVCLSFCRSVCLSFFLSFCLSVCLSMCLCVCLPVCLSACLSDSLTDCLGRGGRLGGFARRLSVCLHNRLRCTVFGAHPRSGAFHVAFSPFEGAATDRAAQLFHAHCLVRGNRSACTTVRDCRTTAGDLAARLKSVVCPVVRADGEDKVAT